MNLWIKHKLIDIKVELQWFMWDLQGRWYFCRTEVVPELREKYLLKYLRIKRRIKKII